uniref:Uncharacterized protein n=2 Tax=Physcomitrium patens TaxID=3218 RepID=A0A7I4ASS0_PHYPA
MPDCVRCWSPEAISHGTGHLMFIGLVLRLESKGTQQVELELRLLEAFAIYRPSLLAGMHRHFILFGLMHHLERRLNQRFSPDEVLQLLDRFFNLDLLEPDDEELELVNHKEDFSLPQSILEEIKRKKISS